ncbi:hypothetical protein CCACVL1_27656, partial [Corchorus capsularis]
MGPRKKQRLLGKPGAMGYEPTPQGKHVGAA